MEELKVKLDEIIDDVMQKKSVVWDLDCITKLQEEYAIFFPKDYIFYLQYYGNDYIKEGYRFKPKKSLMKVLAQESFELNAIFGFYDDENNLTKELGFCKDIIPINLFPIADLLGGNFVCMDKENGQIYFWIHDEMEDVYFVAPNFTEFIMRIQFEQSKKIDLDSINLNLSSDLDELLRNAAEEYK